MTAETTTTTVPERPECADDETLVVLRERPPSYQCVATGQPDPNPTTTTVLAPPERGTQSTIPDARDRLGWCYSHDGGEPIAEGGYTILPQPYPAYGTTEKGFQSCWAPIEVSAETRQVVSLSTDVPSGGGEAGSGPVATVPVPTAVNTGDAVVEPFVTGYEAVALTLFGIGAVVWAVVTGVRNGS